MAYNLSDWETSKENVQPLKSGRDPAKLALRLKDPSTHILEERQGFENQLTCYTGDDPLSIWLKYLQWATQAFVTSPKIEVVPLFERCLNQFIDVPRYKDDPRFTRTWIQYAEMCKEPLEIFKVMESRGIGLSSATLYSARAVVLEKIGRRKEADKVYEEGIRRNAQPLDVLRRHYTEFQARVARQIQAGVVESCPSDENTRGALGSLKATKGQVSSVRQSAPQKLVESSAPNNKRKALEPASTSFQIYEDTENDTAPSSTFSRWGDLASELDKHKENSAIPAKWTETKIPQKKARPPTQPIKPAFEIYEEESEAPVQPKVTQLPKLRLQLEGERNRHDVSSNPFVTFGNPTSSTVNSQVVTTSSTSNVSETGERLGYSRALLCIDGEEMSFEEVRALGRKPLTVLGYFEQEAIVANTNVAKAAEIKKLDAKDDSFVKGIHSVNDAASTPIQFAEPSQKGPSSFGFTTPQRDASSVLGVHQASPFIGSSPTINTRIAVTDIEKFFSTPLNKKPLFEHSSHLASSKVPTTLPDIENDGEHNDANQENIAPEPKFGAKLTNRDIIAAELGQLGEEADRGSSREPTKMTNRGFIFQQLSENNLDVTTDLDSLVEQLSYSGLVFLLTNQQSLEFDIFEDPEIASPSNAKSAAEPRVLREVPSQTTIETKIPNTPGCDITQSNSSLSLSSSSFSISSSSSGTSTFVTPASKGRISMSTFSNALTPITPFHSTPCDSPVANKYSESQLMDINTKMYQLVCELPNFVEVSGEAPYCAALKDKRKITTLEPDEKKLELDDLSVEVTGCIGEGAFATVYLVERTDTVNTNNLAEDVSYALKVQAPPCPHEFYISHQLQERLPRNIKPSFMLFHSQHMYDDKSFLLMNYSDQGTLLDLINAFRLANKTIDEPLAVYYIAELLRILEGLHKCSIIHGDIKPDNCLIRDISPEEQHIIKVQKGIQLIDYGRSIDTQLYPPGTQFVGACHADGLQCTEMTTGKPWTYQIDTYGLCSIAYCLLHGTYMDVVPESSADGSTKLKPKLPLKRFWQKQLWDTFFDQLLNNPTQSLTPLKELFDTYLQTKITAIQAALSKQSFVLYEYLKKARSGKL